MKKAILGVLAAWFLITWLVVALVATIVWVVSLF